MRISRSAIVAAVPVVMLAVVAPMAVAEPDPATELQVVVEEDSGAQTEVTLECDPVGGTHPHADKACQMLADVNGDAAEVSHSDGPCVFVYQPITGRISGHWGESDVEYSETFPNRCFMIARKGPLFDF